MTNRKAASTRLEPGEHSIDRVSKKDLPNGKVRIEWSVRLHDGRLESGIRTQGDTLGEVRRKKLVKAMGGITAVKRADLDELKSHSFLPDKVAEAIYDKFHT